VTGKHLYLNDGSGTFAQKADTDFGGGTYGVDVGDVDNDGDVDVVLIQSSSFRESAVWLNYLPTYTITSQAGAHGIIFPTGEEYIAGTDPTSAVSVFQCVEISPTNTTPQGKRLRWFGTTGRIYTVQGSTNLTTPWFDLATNLPPDGVWTDTSISTNDTGYYRLKVQLPP
jgi:hypothetical protein